MGLRSQIIRDEGVRPTAYIDTTGNVTFAVGHKGSTPLSIKAIDQILDDDIASHEAELLEAFPWVEELSPNRLNVLINMAFNLGVGGLSKFTTMWTELRHALVTGDYAPVAAAMLNSQWARQVGIVRRTLAWFSRDRAEMLAIRDWVTKQPGRAERLAKQMVLDVEQ